MSRGNTAGGGVRRTATLALGWVLVVAGIVALVIPGPGLLLLVAGLAILSQKYEWAERRLKPVRAKAFEAAAGSVRTWPRIMGSCLGALVLAAVGVVWGLAPPAPEWWPLHDGLWLPGGWGTGSSLILSAVVALIMVVYSYRRFRSKPDPAGAGAA